jgi:hypothetical protein
MEFRAGRLKPGTLNSEADMNMIERVGDFKSSIGGIDINI